MYLIQVLQMGKWRILRNCGELPTFAAAVAYGIEHLTKSQWRVIEIATGDIVHS